MSLPEFDYFKPRTLIETIEILTVHQTKAQIMAGGTDIIVRMKQGVAKFRYLVDITGLPFMSGITMKAEEIEIGALTRLNTIGSSPEIIENASVLATAASLIGMPQHRNMGTLGGNICLDTRCYYFNQLASWRQSRPLCYKTGGDRCHVAKRSPVCHAVFSADTPLALMALGARVRTAGPYGIQEMPIEFLYSHDGMCPIKLEAGAIVVAVIIPRPQPYTGFAYEKYRLRQEIDFPIVGIAVAITLDGPGGICRRARIVLNAVGPGPKRALEAEAALEGRKAEESLEEAAELAYQSAKPVHPMGASPINKKTMVRVLVRDALVKAVGMANGNTR